MSSSSVEVSLSAGSMGDSTELVVLWESEVGLALFRFLFLLVVLVSVLGLDGWGAPVPATSYRDSISVLCQVCVEVGT